METKTRIFGMPLISVGSSVEGFIAIGWMGRGVVIIAQFGYGVIAVTQFGFGVISISQFGLGLITIGQGAFALFLAIGQFALGFIANGINAFGYYRMTGPGVWKRIPELFHLVETNPFPLVLWGCLWAVICVFLASQRDKFTSDMSFRDLLRPRAKHHDESIRARSVSSISSQDVLLDLILNDPSEDVKYKAFVRLTDREKLLAVALAPISGKLAVQAVKKISAPDDLRKIAAGAAVREARLSSIGRLSRTDPSLLTDLACTETNQKILEAVIDAIKEQSALRRIIKNASSPHARIIAIYNLTDPAGEEMFDIVREEKEITVCESAVYRITDTRILTEIIRGDYHDAIRKAAIEQIEDKKLLAGLASENLPDITYAAITHRISALRPIYYSLKAEFSCPFCSQPVFINTPVQKIRCRSCLKETSIPAVVWKSMRSAGFGVGRFFMGPLNLLIDKRRNPPVCSKCQKPLQTDEIASGSREPVTCASCGTAHATFPMPPWLKWTKFAEQVFASEDSEKTAGTDDVTPAAFSCIKCGAPLEATAATPRNATCRYCNTVQYLPDQMWLSLHPVTIKQPWYIRCNYRERIE